MTPLFKHQEESVETLEKLEYALDASDPGCVSADTEFLTPTGWKRIDEYVPGDQVAQFDPHKNREVTWVTPSAYVKAPCATMLAIAPSRGTSQRLSYEHRVLFYNEDGTFGETSANEFANTLIKKGANGNKRKFATTFSIAGTSGLPQSAEELRLMVAVIADGHFPYPGAKCTVRLKKQRKQKRLRELLKDAKVEYVERTCGGNSEYQVFKFRSPVEEKTFGPRWWAATQAQLETIAEELPHWDGSERKANGTSFCSCIRESAEFAQYAFAANKWTASIAKHERKDDKKATYDVYAARNKQFIGPGRSSSVYEVPNPEGFKYCFTVPTTFWLARHNGHIFATGNTGKTRTQIEAYAARRRSGGGKALVVAPRSLLRSAWEQDFHKFAPWIRTSIATAAHRESAFKVDADVYIINTDGVNWLAKQKPEFFNQFDTLVIDEISSFKHHTSQRSKAINKIKKYFKYRYGLTGTPDSNGISDLWHQIYILDNGQRLGTSFYHFRQSVCTPQQTGPGPAMVKWVDRPNAEVAVGALISDMTIRHKFEDCIDIPPNYQYPVPYFMPPKQEKVYKDMARDARVQLSSGQIVSTVNAAGLVTKLLQIASGAVYNEDGTYSVIDTGRYEQIADLVSERKHSVVFFNWIHQKDELIKEFKAKGITYVVVDGSTSDKDREEAVRLFQAGFYRVFLGHPQSVAHGLTLTKGTTTIWANPTYNLEHWLQGNRRIYRAGQTERTETIVLLAPGTIENRVFTRMTEKGEKQTSLLEILQESFNETTKSNSTLP